MREVKDMNIPKDPFILYSYINTQLRDNYNSLSELAKGLGVQEEDITNSLAKAGFEYDPESNRFLKK